MRARRPQDMPGELGQLVRAQLAREAKAEGDRAPRPQAVQTLPRKALTRLTKLEARYRAWLEAEQAAGRVLTFRWEPFRLVLRHGGNGQKGMTYAPDALVVVPSGGLTLGPAGTYQLQGPPPAVELHEVKPTKPDGSPLWLGDSRTKLLAAVEILRGVPWTFVLITPDGAGWRRTCL